MESYAPGLSYAPVSVASGRAPLPTEPAVENGVSHERAELLKRLKTGKKWLREQRPALALEEFKIALGLARQAQDPVCEKKAARGLGENPSAAQVGWTLLVPCGRFSLAVWFTWRRSPRFLCPAPVTALVSECEPRLTWKFTSIVAGYETQSRG
jgi:hypothetical protein